LLGAVGNSGNSTMPHLHLQADRAGMELELRFTGITGRLYRGRRIRNGMRADARSGWIAA
jgi:murein DD-endopeptidase MepM/ murein hydrolase activator NlpD